MKRLTTQLAPLVLVGVALSCKPQSPSSTTARAAAPPAQRLEGVGESALKQISDLELQKVDRTPAQNKLDSQLFYALHREALKRIAPDMEPDLTIRGDGQVLVDVDAEVSADLLGTIRLLGGEVISSFARDRTLRALVPLAQVETLADDPVVVFIALAVGATTNTGSVTGEGDVTHRAADGRSVFGVTGAGINVGVLSDSVDFLAASQALGDIGPVTVLPGQSGVGTCGGACTGEGTAMLEIVADLAPGAGLFFATGSGGPAQMAANIQALQAAGCSVIVDDVTYFNESPFQDGPISQAVNAVTAAGALYFSSARNSGNEDDGTSGTWEGDFLDGGAVSPPLPGSGRLHDFGGATFDAVALGGNRRRLDLFWADPLGASGNDYDLFVVDSTGTTVLRASTNSQTGSQSPYEALNTLNVGERVVIVKAAAAADRYLHLDSGRGRLTIHTALNVRGHNASGAPGAFSVAATDVANSFPNPFSGGTANPVELFSSDGTRRIFFDPSGTAITPGDFSSTGGAVLQKPDITAADGVTSSAAIPAFNPFFGTSAAAPHAAAIAALLLSFDPTLTAAQIRTALTATALDIEAPGVDRDSGAGIIMAFAALKLLNPCTLTCPANVTQPDDPDQCGALVTYPAPSAVGGCGTVTCSPASGSFFPVGTTTVNCNTASEDSCSFAVTVNDVQPPVVTCSVLAPRLWPPNHDLVNVGLTVAVSDNCPGTLPVSVDVFSDEDDEMATGDGNFSPDAVDIAPGTLRLRRERRGDADGRVYLDVESAVDASGNVGFACCTVVVPHDRSPASIASVGAQAAAARAFCADHGAVPPGYFVVGDGTAIGPKQ
jgi:Subtilase family